MKFLHEPIEYNEDGSVKDIKNDIWVKDWDRKHIVVAVVPRFEGWAYVEPSIDIPVFERVEYKRTEYYSKGWTNYSRIK